MEVQDLEVVWIKVMPKMPRIFSCILLACIYYTPKTEYLKIRHHLITSSSMCGSDHSNSKVNVNI